MEQHDEPDNQDEDGYPTEAALDKIRAWPVADIPGLLAFMKGLWNWPDWGWREDREWRDECHPHADDLRLEISTGGWSGNESLIDALMENKELVWMLIWYSSRRVGHYEFHVQGHWNGHGGKLEQEPAGPSAEGE